MNLYKALLMTALGFAIMLGMTLGDAHQAEASEAIVQQGDRGGVVWDVQHRLQQLGLYQLSMDGVYGSQTRQAVAQFQRQYGLPVTGSVDLKTLRTLRANTFTVDEIEMMAKLVYGEARGESFEGQVAVAAVVLNRLKSPKFPNTVKEVIFEPRAFTAVADGQYYQRPNRDAYRAVYHAIRGWDPSEGALYYFNPDVATSGWIWSRPQIKRIDNHIFAR
ncbi:spore cortex-lytic enzyme [Caldalkalibacillus thermarum TA2.A1]|uniref:Spore cortex-lytic enzyme n=2 Tax=Caldalkalibacillus thermarum (strain TA2.A1) TaxID=986075 RepID=F5L555_CALTT|nr:spore cortex-lytic enzyme [Caldalkalibacillus thermarum]EGL83522.1 spore cortex-lytic enzyme [Caldalkalibacillus thermarum TA2.A1]